MESPAQEGNASIRMSTDPPLRGSRRAQHRSPYFCNTTLACPFSTMSMTSSLAVSVPTVAP